MLSKVVGASDRSSCCPGKKAGAEAKKGGRNLPGSPFLVSAKRRRGKGIGGMKRQEPASGKEGSPPFWVRRMLLGPGMSHVPGEIPSPPRLPG